jgi:hypothetical protein
MLAATFFAWAIGISMLPTTGLVETGLMTVSGRRWRWLSFGSSESGPTRVSMRGAVEHRALRGIAISGDGEGPVQVGSKTLLLAGSRVDSGQRAPGPAGGLSTSRCRQGGHGQGLRRRST